MTWEELKQTAVGIILHDEFDEGIRFIIMRGPCSLCAYVGIPIGHPLAGYYYKDLPIDAHGGLTFASEGRGAWPTGWYWYGWDYAHAGDYPFYYEESPLARIFALGEERKWLLEDVKDDSRDVINDFKKLAKLAEVIGKRKEQQ